MVAVVYGGASSGKSAYAESLALSLPGPHVYAATMRRGGQEAARRIARHREQRVGKGFATVELAHEEFSENRAGTVLLEDVSNLVLNELEGCIPDILAWDNAVIVANDIGSDGVAYDTFTLDFMDRAGRLVRDLAPRADVVVEVVAGCPLAVKGSLP